MIINKRLHIGMNEKSQSNPTLSGMVLEYFIEFH